MMGEREHYGPMREFANAVRQCRRGLNEAFTIADLDLKDDARLRAVSAMRDVVTRVASGDLDEGFVSALESAAESRTDGPTFSDVARRITAVHNAGGT